MSGFCVFGISWFKWIGGGWASGVVALSFVAFYQTLGGMPKRRFQGADEKPQAPDGLAGACGVVVLCVRYDVSMSCDY